MIYCHFSEYSSPDTLLHMYESIAQPHLEYMPPKYGTHTSSQKDIKVLEGVQKSALRMCSNI